VTLTGAGWTLALVGGTPPQAGVTLVGAGVPLGSPGGAPAGICFAKLIKFSHILCKLIAKSGNPASQIDCRSNTLTVFCKINFAIHILFKNWLAK
jgi:hypothetical protein